MTRRLMLLAALLLLPSLVEAQTTWSVTPPSGSVILNGLKFPLTDGTAGQVIKTDGSASLSFTNAGTGTVTASGTLTNNAFVTGAGTTVIQATALTGLVLGRGATAPTQYPGSSCSAGSFVTSLDLNGATTCAVPSGSGGNVNASATLTNNQLVVGSGSATNIQTLANGSGFLMAGTPPTWASISLTNNVVGILPAANGGTGQNSSGWSALPLVTAGTWSQYTGSACPSGQLVASISAVGVVTCVASGNVTNSGALTANQLVIGQGGSIIATFASGSGVLHSGLPPTWASVSLTNDVAGVLGVSNGGTGTSSVNGLVLGNGTSPMTAYGGATCAGGQFATALSSTGGLSCSPATSTSLPTSTFAGLPAAGTVGAIRYVTDNTRGPYIDMGTQFYSVQGGVTNVRNYGAKGDGSTDDTAALQAAFTAACTDAPGSVAGVVYFPPGKYFVASPPVTSTCATGLIVRGAGSGWSPTINQTQPPTAGNIGQPGTVIFATTTNAQVLSFNTNASVIIEDLRVNAPQTGLGINITGPGGANSPLGNDGSVLRRVVISANNTASTATLMSVGVRFQRALNMHVQDSFIEFFSGFGIEADADQGCDSSAFTVSNTQLQGNADSAGTSFAIFTKSGATQIIGNYIFATAGGISIFNPGSAGCTQFLIANNQIVTTAANQQDIRVFGGLMEYFSITGNYLANLPNPIDHTSGPVENISFDTPTAGEYTMVNITGNLINSFGSGSPRGGILFTSVSAAVVANNVFDNGNNAGAYFFNYVGAPGAANSVNVSNTQFIHPVTSAFLGTGYALNQGSPGIPFSEILAWDNGSQVYCRNCTIANPCAGASTGAYMKRLNGVNVCN